jgi:hypothetical protein
VRERASPEYLDTLASVPPNSWIPFELSCSGVEAAVDVLGPDEARALWREVFTQRFVKTPIIGGLIQAWVRLFGLSPTSIIKAIPKGFEGTYRNVAEVDVEELSKGYGRVRLHQLAPRMLAHPKYWYAWRGTFEGGFDLCSVEGALEVELDEAARSARLHFRW